MTDGDSGARNEILGRLTSSLSTQRPLFRAAGARKNVPGVPAPVASAVGGQRELAEAFGAKLTKIHGSYDMVESADQVLLVVAGLVERWRGTSEILLSWAGDELPVPGLEQRLAEVGTRLIVPEDLHREEARRMAAQANVGITGVEAAFAGTGSMLMLPAVGRSRAAALLPFHHIALVPLSRIYPTFEAWMAEQREDGRLDTLLRQSAQLAFVTGPSKSADIELNLTLGVHGPKVVHAVIFDG